MQELAIAAALVLVFEGLIYALFPTAMKRMMEKAIELPENSLRLGGVVAIALGVFAVWLLRGA